MRSRKWRRGPASSHQLHFLTRPTAAKRPAGTDEAAAGTDEAAASPLGWEALELRSHLLWGADGPQEQGQRPLQWVGAGGQGRRACTLTAQRGSDTVWVPESRARRLPLQGRVLGEEMEAPFLWIPPLCPAQPDRTLVPWRGGSRGRASAALWSTSSSSQLPGAPRSPRHSAGRPCPLLRATGSHGGQTRGSLHGCNIHRVQVCEALQGTCTYTRAHTLTLPGRTTHHQECFCGGQSELSLGPAFISYKAAGGLFNILNPPPTSTCFRDTGPWFNTHGKHLRC